MGAIAAILQDFITRQSMTGTSLEFTSRNCCMNPSCNVMKEDNIYIHMYILYDSGGGACEKFHSHSFNLRHTVVIITLTHSYS